MKTRFKFIHFEKGSHGGGPGFYCKNNKTGDILCFVTLYLPWQRVCLFTINEKAVLSPDCQKDIRTFCLALEDLYFEKEEDHENAKSD